MLPSMHSTMHLYPVNGAAARVGQSDTAWSYRDATWSQVIVGVDPDPAKKDEITAGRATITTPCIPTGPAAPMSTS